MVNVKSFLSRNILYIAWIQSIVATAGSLYYSEIKHYTPCVLCWYQRIFMFPLVIILAIGILRKDKGISYYVLPLSLTGILISFYQVLLQQGIINEAFTPCTYGISCTTKYVSFLGFITIPLMSFAAFFTISVCMYLYLKWSKK